MSIDSFYRHRGYITFAEQTRQTQFREIAKCFVRKDHSCGKFLGASKSCFVACPSTDEVETILALIIEKLTKIGIEPIIAIKERAYGQDIFCTKICGKIIESQFCIVILDDTVQKINGASVNVPNSNVYYEYGLMTALGKYVIPLQKDGQALAFNIQTHDTIKYTPRNISSELDRALKDAAKITEEDRTGYAYSGLMSERLFGRSIEINGYQKKEYGWFLYDDIKDTVFTGYSHPTRREYLFFAVASDKDFLRACLTDAQVITKRLEIKYKELVEDIDSLSKQITKLNKENKESEKRDKSTEIGPLVRISRLTARSRFSLEHELNNAIEKREASSSKLELIQNSKFAIVLQPEVIELQEKIIEQYASIQKEILSLPLYIGNISGIQIADLNIVFKTPDL